MVERSIEIKCVFVKETSEIVLTGRRPNVCIFLK